jgi:hypothetical protein
MKLSEKTVDVLKNFSAINPSIIVKEGSVLATISNAKTIIARAKVPDNFNSRFSLHNLTQLIGQLSSIENAVIAFNDKFLRIQGDSPSEYAEIVYADEASIRVPPERYANGEFKLPSIDATCSFTANQFKKIQQELGLLTLPEVAFVGDGSKIYMRAIDSKNVTSNKYSIEVGTTTKTFCSIFKAENLKIVSGDYKVDISSKGISHFIGADIEYWIAVETNSTYE